MVHMAAPSKGIVLPALSSATAWALVSLWLACASSATTSASDLRIEAELALHLADDECDAAQGGCELSVLQLRQLRSSRFSVEEAPPMGAKDKSGTAGTEDASGKSEIQGGLETSKGAYYFDAPEGWISNDQKALEDTEANAQSSQMNPLASWSGGDLGKPELQANSYCAAHSRDHSCFLYTACRHRYCVMWGYLVVPGAPCLGTEEMNSGNAGSYDYLMTAAEEECPSGSCVLIVNPMHHRTQEQLHIHFRHYNGGGAAMKKALEGAVCTKMGWVDFRAHGCASGKARLYRYWPGVFSQVASAYGGGSLAHVGIEVWPKACGGGYIVQTSTHCSIEHSISSR